MDKSSFKSYLKERFESDFEAIWASFFEPKWVGFFSIKKSLAIFDEIAGDLSGDGVKQILPNFYIAPAHLKPIISRSNSFNSGEIYIQNPSSYLAALALNAKKSDAILDMCASPGGKTIAIAANSASADIAAMESDKSRFFTLKKNLAKYGFKHIRTYNKDARSVAVTCKERFSRILLDAPCSSYSHFGGEFEAKSSKELKKIGKLQAQLFAAAAKALKPGGVLIYSTCTFFDAENDDIAALAEGLGLINQKVDLGAFFIDSGDGVRAKATKYGLFITPDAIFDAFYIAKFIKP